jgi:TonB family protein
MRSAAAALCVLLLPITIFSQDHLSAPADKAISPATVEKQFTFSGDVTLRIGQDSMTDRQTCVVVTSNSSGASFLVNKSAVAIIAYGGVNYSSPAFLRLADDAPMRLFVPNRPGMLVVPSSKSAAVVRALYTRSRVRLRFFKWPEGLFDDELKIGDFSAAYDRAVELCAWPKLSVPPAHPSDEELAKWKAILDDSAAPGESESTAALDQIESASAKALRISMKAVGEAECIYCPPPRFPDGAHDAKLSGSVILMAKITRDGRATDISVTREPGMGLGEKATEAVRTWRFRPPAELGGLPYVVKFIEVKFRDY